MTPIRRKSLLERLRPKGHDDGFTLVEIMVSLGVLVTAMLTSAGFFFSALKSTGGQVQRQTALNIAQKQLEYVRSVPVSSLLTGRLKSDVASLNTALGGTLSSVGNLGVAIGGLLPGYEYDGVNANGVSNSLSATIPLCTDGDPSHNAVSGTGCPTGGTTPAAITGTKYTVRTAIDSCIRNASTNVCDKNGGGSAAGIALLTSLTTDLTGIVNGTLSALKVTQPTLGVAVMRRVTVDVSWPKQNGLTCTTNAQGDCHISVNTLVDASQDQQFSPPSPPKVSRIVSGSSTSCTTTTASSIYKGMYSSANVAGTGTLAKNASSAIVICGQYFAAAGVTVSGSNCTVTGTPVVTGGDTNNAWITGITVKGGTTAGGCVLTITNNVSGLQVIAPPIPIPSSPTITSTSIAGISLVGGSSTLVDLRGTDFLSGAVLSSPQVKTCSLILFCSTTSFSYTNASNVVGQTTFVSTTDVQIKVPIPNSLLGGVTLYFTILNPDGGTSNTYAQSILSIL